MTRVVRCIFSKNDGHCARVETGAGERLESDPVGFALEVAGVAELRLRHHALRGHHRALRDLGPRASQQQRGSKRDQSGNLHLLLRAEHARDVPLRDVRHLVPENRGHFRFALGVRDQAGVHADESARHRERVDRRVAYGEELEVLARAGRDRNQPCTQLVQIVADLRIIEVRRLAAADLAHDAFADLALELRRQDGARPFAQLGQGLSEGPRQDRKAQSEQQGECAHPAMIPSASDSSRELRLARKTSRRLTHFDPRGRAHMVDVGAKDETAAGRRRLGPHPHEARNAAQGRRAALRRRAMCSASRGSRRSRPPSARPSLIRSGPSDRDHARRDRVRRSTRRAARSALQRRSRARGRTGVEMEALTAAAVGLLTIYDMLKAVDRGMSIARAAARGEARRRIRPLASHGGRAVRK